MTEWAYVLRILLAAGLSAVIGIEREFHGRPAGLRTHLLVGCGASLVVVAFLVVWNAVVEGDPATHGLPSEIGRLAAGVITGIGFLGAGTIIKVGDWVRGLTTAASLWFVATLGIASGLGATWIAIAGGGIGLAILAVVDPLASRIPSTIYQTLTLIVEADRQAPIQEAFRACCIDRRMRATLVNWEWDSAAESVTLTYRIRNRGRTPDLQGLAEKASELDGVRETQIRL
jgi:putative Mg2+ transporter-C (MgtC) family protein